MCKDSILGNKDFVADLQRLAGEWRNAVVAEVGRKRYDELSSKLGTDLALAYVDHRIEQMMVDRMVRDQMPKGSFDYILRKGASGSLFGLSQELMKSPLQREIEERGEAIYKPSKTEKGAAKGVSFASDVVAFGGVYSWGALARLAGAEVVFSGLESVLDKKQQKKGLTVDQCVSTGLFGSGSTLADIRKDSWRIKTLRKRLHPVGQRHPVEKDAHTERKARMGDGLEPWQSAKPFPESGERVYPSQIRCDVLYQAPSGRPRQELLQCAVRHSSRS